MIIPPSLQSGDSIALISPAGQIDPIYIERFETALVRQGFCPIRMAHVAGRYGRYAGTVEERIADLRSALTDDSIRAVWCSRGGYGAMQLLELLRPGWFLDHPKWLIGYSDITILHQYTTYTGVASLHAPMARHFAEESAGDLAIRFTLQMLTGQPVSFSFPSHPFNRIGSVHGMLEGGNLAVLHGLRGTPYDLIGGGTILFIEDIGERPYQIERMMLNLLHSRILASIGGLIVGQFTDYDLDPSMPTPYELIDRIVRPFDFPVLYGFPVGHVRENFPLVCGGMYGLSITSEGATLDYCSLPNI